MLSNDISRIIANVSTNCIDNIMLSESMVDPIINTLQTQVYCINKTNFRCSHSNAMTNIIAKESVIAKIIAMAMLMTKLLAIQIVLA